MLSRQNRLTTRDFKELKKGVNSTTPLFNAKVYNGNINKLGIVISKKHLRKSTKRNALKRKICYAYRQVVKNNPDYKDKIVLHYKLKDRDQKLPEYNEIENNLKQIIK